jgi:23S rRNA (guanosine2251-2'-O)-methyltransferase
VNYPGKYLVGAIIGMRKLKLEELGRLTPDQFRQELKLPVRLVLDNWRSALNVGSAFRTADGFAIEAITLSGISATPPHREILKTAIGASEVIPWTYFPKTEEALLALRKEGFVICAIEQTDQSSSLADFRFEAGSRYALVFGNEVDGVDADVLGLFDHAIEIPQFGTKHSFNVAVSVGIVLWEFWRQWKATRSQ